MDALEPADRVFVNILEEIRIAADAERAGHPQRRTHPDAELAAAMA